MYLSLSCGRFCLCALDIVWRADPYPCSNRALSECGTPGCRAGRGSDQPFLDGGILERRVEDVDRLILARHVSELLPVVVYRPSRVRGKRRDG